jgi:putative DNA primase/helicase
MLIRRDHCDAFKAMSEFTVGDADGQVKRAASKFGLVAMAGELAIGYDIVPWPKGYAIKAAAEMFDAWQVGRGTLINDGPRQIFTAALRLR